MSGEQSSDETVQVPKQELYELYSTLADATTAASTGDPNECARLTSEAKEQVTEIYENHAE